MLLKNAITLRKLKSVIETLKARYEPLVQIQHKISFPKKNKALSTLSYGFTSPFYAPFSFLGIKKVPTRKKPFMILFGKKPNPFILFHELNELHYYLQRANRRSANRKLLNKALKEFRPSFYDVKGEITNPEYEKLISEILLHHHGFGYREPIVVPPFQGFHMHPFLPIHDWNIFVTLPKKYHNIFTKKLPEINMPIFELRAKVLKQMGKHLGVPSLKPFVERRQKIPKALRRRIKRRFEKLQRDAYEQLKALEKIEI